jgi:hypothetical protein
MSEMPYRIYYRSDSSLFSNSVSSLKSYHVAARIRLPGIDTATSSSSLKLDKSSSSTIHYLPQFLNASRTRRALNSFGIKEE